MAVTKHNHQVVFGRKVDGCPRCDELKAGSPVRAGWQRDYFNRKGQQDEMDRKAIAAHFAPGGPHDRGLCGPVCTAFDW